MLDQLKEGLAVLGFGSLLERFPDVFEKLFVFFPDSSSPSVDNLLALLKPPVDMNAEQASTFLFLQEYVRQLDKEGMYSYFLTQHVIISSVKFNKTL